MAGSVGTDNPGDAEHDFFTAGIGAALGPVNTSITAAYIWDFKYDFS